MYICVYGLVHTACTLTQIGGHKSFKDLMVMCCDLLPTTDSIKYLCKYKSIQDTITKCWAMHVNPFSLVLSVLLFMTF